MAQSVDIATHRSLTQVTLDCDFADFYAFRKTNNELLWEHACRRPKRF